MTHQLWMNVMDTGVLFLVPSFLIVILASQLWDEKKPHKAFYEYVGGASILVFILSLITIMTAALGRIWT